MVASTEWTDLEISILTAALRKTPWRGDRDLASELSLSRSYEAIRVKLGRLRKDLGLHAGLPIPEGTGYIKRFDRPLRVEGNTMVAGDFQIPFYHAEATRRLIVVAKKLNITQLVIGGDFFDLPYWSAFDRTLYQQQLTWTDDKAIGQRILEAMLEQFAHIYITSDNHSLRYFRKTEFKESIVSFYGGVVGDALADRVSASEYPVIALGDSWLVIHPAAYRQLKLSLASDLAMKLQKNVYNFHGHMAAKGISKYGNYLIVDGACMTDPVLHEYVAMKITPHPIWNPGFYAHIDSYPHEFWMHELYPWSKWLLNESDCPQ